MTAPDSGVTMGTNPESAAAIESLRTITATLSMLVQNVNEMNEERTKAKAEATAASEAKAAAAGKDKDDHKKTLDHHFQKKIGKFDATAKGWSDWRFQVRIAAGAADTKIVEVLNLVEKLDEELTTITRAEWEKEHELLSEKGFHLKRWSAEL